MSSKNNYGISEDSTAKIKSILQTNIKIQKAIIYGSRAKGNFSSGSDIDLCLFGESLVENDLYSLRSMFLESNLPYTFDLTLYKSIDNEDLKNHIDRIGKGFFEAK